MRSKRNQFIFLAVISIWNLSLYSPIIIFFDFSPTPVNSTSQIKNVWQFSDLQVQQIMNYVDTLNRLIIPVILITVFTVLLIVSIVQSSQRVTASLSTTNQIRRDKRDKRIAILLIFVNIFYVLLDLPLSVTTAYLPFTRFYFIITFYVFYMSFVVNFYLILITNSLFRTEFCEMIEKAFGCKLH